MTDLLAEFQSQVDHLLATPTPAELPGRAAGFCRWLESDERTKRMLTQLAAKDRLFKLWQGIDQCKPLGSLEDHAAVGLDILRELEYPPTRPDDPAHYVNQVASRLRGPGSSAVKTLPEIWKVVNPLVQVLRVRIGAVVSEQRASQSRSTEQVPVVIHQSLAAFMLAYPDPSRNAFLMMSFDQAAPNKYAAEAMRSVLKGLGITGHRADDREFHEDLFPNVQTYMHGCGFGIALIERETRSAPNHNVALEIGYMRALRKPVCILKDESVPILNADLIAKLYRPVRMSEPTSIGKELAKWMSEKDLLR